MKTCSMSKLVFPNSNSMFEVPAEGSWERSEKRHFPDIYNHSTLNLNESPLAMRKTRILMIDSTRRCEKRHYDFYMGHSYVENYY
ncbi:hypothetical protein QE152_g6439 [Popillia japonica]|uniref:Uncharacterized protein n=1 Tax=Popillia japonica TaxID=7064 RepID=A0AAW1MIA8_POPJA